MQLSPYFTGAAPNFGPPSGMASLIAQDRQGGVDFRGAQMFADVVEKYKKDQDMGKAADYFVKANPEALASMGLHPELWKTLGAGDKANAVTGFMKGQASQELTQRLADYRAQTEERKAQVEAEQNTGTFLKGYAAPLPDGMEDTPENRLQNALKQLPAAASVGRVMPQAMNALEKFANIGAGARMPFGSNDVVDLGKVDPRLAGHFLARQSPKSFMPVASPEADLLATKPSAADVPPGYIAIQSGKGWRMVQDPTQFVEERTGLPGLDLKITRRFVGKPAAAAGTGAAATAPAYKSRADVVAAFKAGQLDRDAAVKILNEQFGVPLK